MAARTDLTALQVAKAIGRTENAVRGARRKLRIDPRKINLAGIAEQVDPGRVEPSVESWGVSVDEARALLNNQMCPICDMGPWKSVLNHVSRAHGIDRVTMRDICGLSMRDKVTDPGASAAWARNGKKKADVLAANSEANKGKKTGPARRTLRAQEMAGHGLRVHEARDPQAVAVMREGFRERMTTPEAKAKWEESMQRVRAERIYTPEQRAAVAERLQAPDVEAKRAAYHAARRQDTCAVDGCENPHLARGYCIKHYRRWKLYGDPLGQGKIGKPPTALSAEQERLALQMLAEGRSQRAVGDHFGCSTSAIWRLVKRTGKLT